MKALFIVRHGKSDWNHPDLRDVDRPLKIRGIDDAEKMGNFIKSNYEHLPDVCITSPACRAAHTALILMRTMQLPLSRMMLEQEFYLASFNDLRDRVRKLSDERETAMIVGHNPGVTDLANSFINNRIQNIPTSGFVYLTFETNAWEKVTYKLLSDFHFHFPKEFYTS